MLSQRLAWKCRSAVAGAPDDYEKLCASQAAQDHVLAQMRAVGKEAGLKVRASALPVCYLETLRESSHESSIFRVRCPGILQMYWITPEMPRSFSDKKRLGLLVLGRGPWCQGVLTDQGGSGMGIIAFLCLLYSGTS